MKKYNWSMTCVYILLAACLIVPEKIYSQNGPLQLSGPRIGLTAIGGELAKTLKDEFDAFPLITQFGWQFEWRYFSI